MTRVPLLSVLVGAAFALLACGSAAPDDGSIDGTGYRTTAPRGWVRTDDHGKSPNGIRADRMYESSRTGRIRDSIFISRIPAVPALARLPIAQIAQRVRHAPARRSLGLPLSSPAVPTALDGEPARTWTYRRPYLGTEVVQRQVIAVHDGVLYTVVVTTRADAGNGRSVFESALAAWRWR